jgi:hypothetical protein
VGEAAAFVYLSRLHEPLVVARLLGSVISAHYMPLEIHNVECAILPAPMALPSSLPLEVVKRYAPAAVFHASEQYFPCSIEYLLSGSTLKFRKWSLNVTIPGQHCLTPHPAIFGEYYVLAYKSYDSEDIWVTRTKDPTYEKSWELFGVSLGQQRASRIDLGFCVFKNYMYIVYTEADTGSAQLWVTWSNDFKNWSFQKIPGQYAYGVALTAMGDKMFLVYSSYNDSHMKWSWTSNGRDWNIMDQVRGEDTNQTPALVTSGDTIFCVFSSSNHDTHLNITKFTERDGWFDSWDVGQSAGQVALAADPKSGKLLMAFSELHSSQFWAVESVDGGTTWINAQEIPAKGTVPSLIFYQDRFQLSWAGTDSNKSFCNCYLTSDLGYNFAPIARPTQADLEAVSSDPINPLSRSNFFLDVDSSVWGGLPSEDTPMYYAVQEDKDTITIHYIYLYAYQPGQTFRVLRDDGSRIDCLLWDLGYHQADVEHFAVVLTPSGEPDGFTIERFIFEADGNPTPFYPDQVIYESPNHAGKYHCHVFTSYHNAHRDPFKPLRATDVCQFSGLCRQGRTWLLESKNFARPLL